MTKEEYFECLNKLEKKQAELDDVYYDDDDPYAFDGDCIEKLHDIADDALRLANAILLGEKYERTSSELL